VLDLVQHPLPTISDWEDALNQDLVRQRYLSLNARPELTTLLLFLKETFRLVLCFDNVDRYPMTFQQTLLSLTVDTSNGARIPIILAIREPNLRRLINEQPLGDIILTDYMERLKAGGEKSVLVSEMPHASIERLLRYRIEFLRQYEGFGTLEGFCAENAREGSADSGQYMQRFWRIFAILAQTFVDKDIYRYCNFNLREILTHYFQFILRILLNPEEEYSIQKLVKDAELVSFTKLRTYLYKWLICGEKTSPPSDGGLLNIYRSPPLNLRALDLRILEFLCNWETKHSDEGLRFDTMASEFQRFDVDIKVLSDHVERL